MLRRNGARDSVLDAAEELQSYGSEVVGDEKTRKRVLAAVTAAVAARQRAKRHAGLIGGARRLAADPVLRAQLAEMVTQLQKAHRRVERKRSHKLRNSMVLLAGFGAASAVVAVPAARERILSLVSGAKRRAESVGGASRALITEEIEVDVPVSTAYNQWTQFEEFPRFMAGVEEVRQLDDTRLRWVAKVGGKRAEWEAKILFQEPDQRIGWQSTDGKETSGTVVFEPAGDGRTRIRLTMSYLPEGVLEQAGSAVGLDARRIAGDLKRFKELIEERGTETGAWRGEIEGGTKTSSRPD